MNIPSIWKNRKCSKPPTSHKLINPSIQQCIGRRAMVLQRSFHGLLDRDSHCPAAMILKLNFGYKQTYIRINSLQLQNMKVGYRKSLLPRNNVIPIVAVSFSPGSIGLKANRRLRRFQCSRAHIPSHSQRPCSYDSLTVSFCTRGLRGHKYTNKERKKENKYMCVCVCHGLFRIPSPHPYFKHPVNGPKHMCTSPIWIVFHLSGVMICVHTCPVDPSSNGWFANGKRNIVFGKSCLFVGHSTQAMFFLLVLNREWGNDL